MPARRRLARSGGDQRRLQAQIHGLGAGPVPGQEGDKNGPEDQAQGGVLCHGVMRVLQKPKWRRMRRPKMVPAKASGTQIQPWMLPVEMPESMAPTLQPKARREL